MFGEAWFSDPNTAGWLLFAAVGLLALLVLAAVMNAAPLTDRHAFTASEPEPREEDLRGSAAPYGLDADEVEERDR